MIFDVALKIWSQDTSIPNITGLYELSWRWAFSWSQTEINIFNTKHLLVWWVFQGVSDKTTHSLYRSHQLHHLYDLWFRTCYHPEGSNILLEALHRHLREIWATIWRWWLWMWGAKTRWSKDIDTCSIYQQSVLKVVCNPEERVGTMSGPLIVWPKCCKHQRKSSMFQYVSIPPFLW